MKRIRLLVIAITLIVSLTISCISASGLEIPSSETANDFNTIAHHYFEKLGDNIPNNEVGSCVYVSMAMLLSFYDFYWNDSFVAEKYEENIKNMETGEDDRLLYTSFTSSTRTPIDSCCSNVRIIILVFFVISSS